MIFNNANTIMVDVRTKEEYDEERKRLVALLRETSIGLGVNDSFSNTEIPPKQSIDTSASLVFDGFETGLAKIPTNNVITTNQETERKRREEAETDRRNQRPLQHPLCRQKAAARHRVHLSDVDLYRRWL